MTFLSYSITVTAVIYLFWRTEVFLHLIVFVRFCSFPRVCPPGSAILHQWQQLAQPHLGVILDARPGVVPKGYRPLELELEQVCVCV